MWRVNSLEKDSDAGKDWGQEENGMTKDEMLDGITNLMDMVWVSSGSWWWTGKPGVLQSVESKSWTDWNYILTLKIH